MDRRRFRFRPRGRAGMLADRGDLNVLASAGQELPEALLYGRGQTPQKVQALFGQGKEKPEGEK